MTVQDFQQMALDSIQRTVLKAGDLGSGRTRPYPVSRGDGHPHRNSAKKTLRCFSSPGMVGCLVSTLAVVYVL